jgi:hypothetical protein
MRSYDTHRHARVARARLMGLAARRLLRASRRWWHGPGPKAWLRPLSYG